MTRLVVSVRDAQEALLALGAGADVIDVKQPDRGSLGAADRRDVERVVAAVAGRCPVSVALGELVESDHSTDDPLAGAQGISANKVPEEACWAKFGLSGCGQQADWRRRWTAAVARLSKGVQPVPVVYADYARATAPPTSDVVDLAVESGARLVLVDTFDKRGGSLLTHWSLGRIDELCREMRRRELRLALAGSLGPCELLQLLPLRPDYLAVRGAVCDGDRGGRLDPRKARQIVDIVRDGIAPAAPSAAWTTKRAAR